MQADGFLNQKQRHPWALTAAIAINLSAVTAVMLARGGYVVIKPPEGIPLIRISDPPPPDPIDQVEPQPNPPKDRVYVPPRRVPTDQPADKPPVTGTTEFPPTGTAGGGTGEGTIAPPEPKATPIPVITEPVPLASAARDFQPPYPPQLLRTGVEGKAVVRVLIGPDGRVKQVAIISADDPLFADATERQALRRWRFKPGTRDGIAVETWKQMTVRFQITS